ncbi:MAG TPA: arsinothricin resistance N-acetyltransferase ArsN1 family B [Burkholderiaceae bacterium]|jgi:phosphinothricin acetyltransferase|nr:arsinothricin resistance N-acetyltransferase ArsN1 family B [Burkholderiaceae bacterium]
MKPFLIRPASEDDAEAISRIYNHYILHTCITFEEQPLSPAAMADRIGEVQAGGFPWLVAEDAGGIAGYAYAAKWRTRPAYRYSAESSVYLSPAAAGKGYGTHLYSELIHLLRQQGIHAVIGGIAQPNEASVALHEKLGFHKVAHFPQVGFKLDRWLDVGYWQLIL